MQSKLSAYLTVKKMRKRIKLTELRYEDHNIDGVVYLDNYLGQGLHNFKCQEDIDTYVEKFTSKYGYAEISIDPDATWFNRFVIHNESFTKHKEEKIEGIKEFLSK